MTGRPRIPGTVSALVAAGALALLAPAVAGASGTAAGQPAPRGTAVVVVTGLTTTTPYSSATRRCRSGQAAGENGTFLLDAFLRAGYRTFTAPVNQGPGRVPARHEDFSDCPPALPARMTVNSIGGLDPNARKLTRFLAYLRRSERVTRVWLVGHSMGGLVARGAIARLAARSRRARPAMPRVVGLATLSTPHLGAFIADVAEGRIGQGICGGQRLCELITSTLTQNRAEYEPALRQITRGHLGAGTRARPGWNRRRGRVPRAIPVIALGGNFDKLPGGNPYAWPSDGYVGTSSALPGRLRRSGVLPSLRCAPPRDDVHSVFLAGVVEALTGEKVQSIETDPGAVRVILRAMRGRALRSVC